MENKARPEHLAYLDSARGIAAIMVMGYHFIGFKFPKEVPVKIASILFNGSDAVSFFFVLSGFVLSYKTIVLGQTMDMGKFFVNRFFRLWPAYFLTILILAIYSNSKDLSAHQLAEIFIYNNHGFWEEVSLLRTPGQYYAPGWTLGMEMALSFFVPFWILIAQKGTRYLWWLILIGLLTAAHTFHFHFLLGILLSCLFPYLSSSSFKDTKWYKYRYPILAAAIVLFSIRHIDRLKPVGPSYIALARFLSVEFFHYTGLASFIFIAAIIQSPRTQRILSHKVLTFFGKISYGIYLMHWLIVVYSYEYFDQLQHMFSRTVSMLIMLAASFICTVLAALLLHYLVELPFIRIGKRIAKRMKPTLTVGGPEA